jgi:hypothetical protein
MRRRGERAREQGYSSSCRFPAFPGMSHFSLPVVYRYDDMRHIAISRDDLEPFYGLDIPHDIVQVCGAILLDPSSERPHRVRVLPWQFVSCACSRVLGSLCLSRGRCRRLCACRHHREDALLFVGGGGKSGEAYVRERAPNRDQIGRATQGRKLPAITTATSTFKMVNTTGEDMIADPRAAITKLFGMDGDVCVANRRCCLQGCNAGRVDRLFRSPDIRSSLFRPRANTKGIPSQK